MIATCAICGEQLEYLEPNPDDHWWAHVEHPADGHEGIPGYYRPPTEPPYKPSRLARLGRWFR